MTRQMDPDRFQMKDIKRRLTRIEKQLARLSSRLRSLTAQCNDHEAHGVNLEEILVTSQENEEDLSNAYSS